MDRRTSVLLLGLLSLFAPCSGSPAPQSAKPPFSYDVDIALNMTGPGPAKSGGSRRMSMSLKIWVKDAAVIRMEIKSPMMEGRLPGGGDQMTMILNRDGMYMINEGGKVATRMPKPPTHSMAFGPASALGPLDFTKGAPDQKTLAEMGFKKTGTGRVGEEACDIYQGQVKGRATGDLKLWLRQKDLFPIKYEMKGTPGIMTGFIKNLQLNAKLSEALFKVPVGYKVTQYGGGAPMGK